MSKKFNDIMLAAWAILLVFNLMILLNDPLKFNFIITGFVAGFFLHMLLSIPLLNLRDKHINFLDKMIKRLFRELEELTRKKLNPKKKRKRR